MADDWSWSFRPELEGSCGIGVGMAACSSPELLVTSCCAHNLLYVFSMTEGGAARLALEARLEWEYFPFRFSDSLGFSGQMAFVALGPGPPLLAVTDAGHDAVHLVDAFSRRHRGYLAPPGAIPGPRGVGAQGPGRDGSGALAAISCWKKGDGGDSEVRLFEARGAAWELLRAVGGPGAGPGRLRCPIGVRFADGGSGVVVADGDNGRVCRFHAADGALDGPPTRGLGFPTAIEGYQGGWLVACGGTNSVEYVEGETHRRLSWAGWEFCRGAALAWVPAVGLVVREPSGRLRVCAPRDLISIAGMSSARVAWMAAVARARPRPGAHPMWR